MSESAIALSCADQEGGGGDRGPDPTPPEKIHKNLGFLSNTGPDHLKNHKATKPEFNVGPLSARQRNAILMAFRWRPDDGPLILAFEFSLPHTLKKRCQSWTPSDKTFWILATGVQTGRKPIH